MCQRHKISQRGEATILDYKFFKTISYTYSPITFEGESKAVYKQQHTVNFSQLKFGRFEVKQINPKTGLSLEESKRVVEKAKREGRLVCPCEGQRYATRLCYGKSPSTFQNIRISNHGDKEAIPGYKGESK